MNVMRALIVMIVLFGFALAPAAGAAERATAEEAQTMVAKAIAAYDAKGEAAFAEMTAPSIAFVDRDLYVFVIGLDHLVRAHGSDASRVGVDTTTEVDADGKRFGQAIVDGATEQGAWINYKWKDPLSGEVQPKSSWVVKHNGYIFGSGIYKP